jgi:hypothetical protein
VPSVSKKQHNFMAAVANNPAFAKKAGIPQSVGKEFVTADKGKSFKEGGHMAISKMGKPVMKKGMSTAKDGMKRPTPMADTMMAGARAPAMPAAPMGGMKRGGGVKKMASGGLAAGHKSADGIASKGHTKGKQVVMKRGGMC